MNNVPYLYDNTVAPCAPCAPAAEADAEASAPGGNPADVPGGNSTEKESQDPSLLEDVTPERKEEKLKKEALTTRHLLTHFPKNKFCEACQRAKVQAKPARSHKKREPSDEHPAAEAFGDEITADHLDSKGPLSQGFEGANFGVVFKDRGTKWIDVFPKATKSEGHTTEAIREF